MFSDEIRVHVAYYEYGQAVAVFLMNDRTNEYAVQGERGLEWHPRGKEMDADSVRPLVVMHHHLADILFKGIADYQDKRGRKPADAGETAGKLAAQTEHLADLRKLLNL